MSDSLDSLFVDLETDKLPSLPNVLVVLLDATHTQVISFDRLSELIKKDAALAARIVNAANAAYYGGQGKLLTFERTLVLLGLDSIKTIAITASVQQFFSRFDGASARRLKRFWRDSLTCATLSKLLAKLTGYEFADEAYLAGLLHNVGELIFASNYQEDYDEITAAAADEEQLLALEQERFGGNRYQAGAWLVSGWELDSFMADAILYQTEGLEPMQDAHHLVRIIYVANRLARYGIEADASAYTAGEALFDLDHELLQGLVNEAREEVREAANSMNIDIGSLEAEDIEAAKLNSEVGSGKGGGKDSDAQSTSEYDFAAEPSEQDQAMQVELAERVRNIALLDGVRQQLSHNTAATDILHTIHQSFNLLFASQRSFFFLLDESDSELTGVSLHNADKALEELSFPVSSKSVIAKSLRDKQPQSSFVNDADSEAISVIDRQVIKLSGDPGILCLPLAVDKHDLGVLVVGVGAALRANFDSEARLYGMFANEAAFHLLAQRQRDEAEVQQEQDDRAYYHRRAREIVHEVANPINIVKNYVHILGTKLDEEHQAQKDLGIIKEELDRAGSILLKLPGISDRQVSASGDELVNANTLISDLLQVFNASLFSTRNIESLTNLDSSMEAIVCDRNLLKQILTNLIKNAAEALPESGRVVVSTQAKVNFGGKKYVEIVVEDNGQGIPDAIQDKLFSPVETTKGEGHAGLGLTIVKNLVDQLEGFISCRSSKDTGTRFEILIPRVLET